MSDKESEFAGFVAVKDTQNVLQSTYRLAGRRETLSKLIQPEPEPESEPSKESEQPEQQLVEHEALEQILYRAAQAAQSLHSLLSTILVSRALHTAFLRQTEILENARKFGTELGEENGFKVYGLDGAWYSYLSEASRRLNRVHDGYGHLPSSVFLSIIAVFDSLMVDFVEDMLRAKPQRINSSKKEIEVSDVLAFDSMDEFREKLIEDELYSFSRDSHEEQVKYIEKVFSVQIQQYWRRWPDFIEIFERRNLVAHGVSNFSQRYADRCKKAGHKGTEEQIGQPVKLTPSYLNQAVNVLFEFYGLLIFSVWRKLFSSKEKEAFAAANQFCFDLISNSIYDAPIEILKYLIDLEKTSVDKRVYLMLVINLASALKHADREEECEKILDREDWETCSDNFQISVAALREETEKVVSKMDIVVNAKLIGKYDFRTWPVFDFVRKEPAFREKFREIFGEDIVDPYEEQSDPQSDNRPTHSEGTDQEGASYLPEPVTKH